jgi:hypothetical protein
MMANMTLVQRLRGALVLDGNAFEDVEHDPSSMAQALTIVVAGSLAASVGAGLSSGVAALLQEALKALMGWVMWAVATYFLGMRMWPEPETKTDLDELMRVIGFAFTPNLLLVLGALPWIGDWVRGVVALWILAGTVVAVRQALDYRSTVHAFRVVVVGWLIFQLIPVALDPGWVQSPG